jgi:hypothetical protein
MLVLSPSTYNNNGMCSQGPARYQAPKVITRVNREQQTAPETRWAVQPTHQRKHTQPFAKYLVKFTSLASKVP